MKFNYKNSMFVEKYRADLKPIGEYFCETLQHKVTVYPPAPAWGAEQEFDAWNHCPKHLIS